jgi:acetyl esterase
VAACTLTSLPPSLLRHIVGPPRLSPDGVELDGQIQALLWLIDRFHSPALTGGPVAAARAGLERSAPTLDLQPAAGVAAYDRAIPTAYGPRRARVYAPESAPASNAPGLIFFHGGGWVLGAIESYDRLCRALAERAAVKVVSVEYRLAPEHPFPAATEDAAATLRWVLENAPRFGLDASRIAVGGDSAGGNLAALASLALRDEGRRPAFQLLIYPATDLTRASPSHATFQDGYFLSSAAIDWYLGHYLRDPADARNPLASPLRVDDLSGLPPALVITAGFDPLRDEGNAYAAKMRAAGVEVELACFAGQMHGFLFLGAAVREAVRAIDLAATRLRGALARKR